MLLETKKIAFLGAGAATRFMAERLLAAKAVSADNLLVSDVADEPLAFFRDHLGVRASLDNSEAAAFGEIVVLSVPPPQALPVLRQTASRIQPSDLLISIVAAVTLDSMEHALGKQVPLLRVIPNAPSAVGAGLNPHVAGRRLSEEQAELCREFLEALGETVEVDESQMEAVAALTAVGPTYLFPIAAALQAAAEGAGIQPDKAQQLVNGLLLGTSRLMADSGRTPAELRRMIGLRTLDEEAASELFGAAYSAAHEKLSGMARQLNG